MEEVLAPTKERLSKGEFDIPHVDQTTSRRAYRARDPFLEMLRQQEIDGSQFQAAEKFERHYHGAEGHDVRVKDYNEAGDVREFGRTVHATALADARKALSKREFAALELMVRDGANLVSVGSKLSAYANKKQCKAYSLALVQGALQRLVDLWLTERRKPPRNR